MDRVEADLDGSKPRRSSGEERRGWARLVGYLEGRGLDGSREENMIEVEWVMG